MTRVDIISGFLGAGKTTLIKKLLKEALSGRKVVLIENEFGEIGIDGGFLKEAGIQITEMNSGCICCSLVGDFGEALKKVLAEYAPDRIIIEPSGVGKLSDVARAVERVREEGAELEIGSLTTVVDAHKAKIYIKNFGEFYNNQVESAQTVVLSRTGDLAQAKIEEVVALIREKNATCAIVTTDWTELSGELMLNVMDRNADLAKQLMEEEEVCPVCGHHHHHDDDDDDDECECGCHHHHHGDDDDDDEECECGCHHHHHHHGHDADEVFVSWGRETAHKFTEAQIEEALSILENSTDYGTVLRAKGILPTPDGEWLHFDLVPGEHEIRRGAADYTGRLCVIGSQLKEEALAALFGL